MPNTGSNWYSCYKCEYDLCKKCMQRRLEKTSKLCYLCLTRVPLDIWRNGRHR